MYGLRPRPASIRRALAAASTAIAASAAPDALAQQAEAPPAQPDDAAQGEDILVVGTRGSAVTDVAPLSTLDADAVAATGATTTSELLGAIRSQTQSASGGDPILLLNGQRISGYEEIGALPPEAIAKVEVLPEQAALKFGYPPTRRVVNFITKQPFRQIETRGRIGMATEGGATAATANLAFTRLRGSGRLTLTGEYRHVEPLLLADRGVTPDPDIPFDAIGNVVGIGGEIDPALSAATGQLVTIAAVPDAPADRSSLAGYIAGANRPRLFDPGRLRTLTARTDALKSELVVAERLGSTVSGSISLSAEQSRDRSLSGPATATLLVPGASPWSPFGQPVLLYRYLTETRPLRQSQTTTTLHGGFVLRGTVSGWRWDLTGTIDQKQIDGRVERSIDPAVLNAAVAAGTDPFVPLDDSLLAHRLVDRARQRVRTAGTKAVLTGSPLRLPAGATTLTATVEAERLAADSETRGPNPFALSLGRTRVSGGFAFDVPIASRSAGVLAFVGDLSANGAYTGRRVAGFGTLEETSWGLTWGPIANVQLLGTIKRSATAPDMEMLSSPVVQMPDVPVFDFANGRTELVTVTQGGNPDLAAERRLVRSLTANWKPFAKRELRVAVTYEDVTIRDQAGTVYAATAQTAAILPDLFTRDSAGRLTAVAYRPINFALERQRSLNIVLSTYGEIGKPAPPPAPGAKAKPRQHASYYAGIGPTIRFSDRLQLRPGTPELDLLRGETVKGWGTARVQGYFYGGLNYLGNGLNVSGWYGGATRVRNADPAADLSFSPVFKLDLGAYVGVHHFLRRADWAKKLQLRLEVGNATGGRQRVRDGHGRTPNRYQPGYIDPVGRTVTLSLRKLF